MTSEELTMSNEEAIAYFIDSNEKIISVAKDENRYNYETQQIEDVFMRRDFEAKELAIKALEQTELNPSYNSVKTELKPRTNLAETSQDYINRTERNCWYGTETYTYEESEGE